MAPEDVINEVISSRDGTNPATSSNAPRRAQLLGSLNQMNSFIHNYKPWEWTHTEGNITILINTAAIALPADFMEFGREGSVYDVARKIRYIEKSRHIITRMRREGNARPYWFCISGGTITLPYTVSSALTLTLAYRVVPEVLVDDDTDMMLPDKYARTVIIPALTRCGQQAKGDPRPDWAAELKDGLSQMCAIENPCKTSGISVPSVYGGAGW